MSKYMVVTNNPMVYEELKDTCDVMYDEVSYEDILKTVRDRIHEGHLLLTHPLSGSEKQEFKLAEKAGWKKILEDRKSSGKTAENDETVKEPEKEIVTAQIAGIEVMDLEDAVKVLWKKNIYAESGMGCTGPIIRVSDQNLGTAKEELREAGYIQ